MEVLETTLEVNKFARRNRHLRIFSKSSLLKINSGYLLKAILSPLGALLKKPFFVEAKSFIATGAHLIGEILPIAPQKRLLAQGVVVSVLSLFVTSFTSSATFLPSSVNYSSDYISAYDISGDVLVTDEDGYLLKINPQTDNSSSRIGLTDSATHVIESGESLSVIAERYGIKVETIMWENAIANANSIRVGQKLMIPPVDGVSYDVAKGDTLEKIAKKYSVTTEAIIAQNALETEALIKGQSIFLPGAKPIAPPVIAGNVRNPAVSRGNTRSYAGVSSATTGPALGKIFIFPTNGKITQGYKGGHYALDIADSSRPPIWAAAGGTVVKASAGTWGGGYGTHIIIDHGDGVKTLYGHMDSLNVSEGQYVNQGDVVGIMGNTGRVYGRTGIHLHWEVM